VFHPHPPWQLWTAEGFESALRLVYDDSRALTPGEAPDFETYRARLNASLRVGSITVGQDVLWELHEGEREAKRLDNDWRTRTKYRPKTFRPYGNPGPGVLAPLAGFSKRSGTCTWKWTRRRLRGTWRGDGERIPCSFSAPAAEVLNVDAYQPGDFHQFFDDPRTRADYLRWAPLLLVAEDFKAGKRRVGDGPRDED
jgi:hypothetical protein